MAGEIDKGRPRESADVIALVGLPGSGKSTHMRELEAAGYLPFDDIGTDWETNIAAIASCVAAGRAVVIAEIMFCDAAWRERLETSLATPIRWRFYRNDPWQCAVNCLYRLMVQLDDRPLMDMLHRIAELSPRYAPPAEALPVHAADAKLRRPTA